MQRLLDDLTPYDAEHRLKQLRKQGVHHPWKSVAKREAELQRMGRSKRENALAKDLQKLTTIAKKKFKGGGQPRRIDIKAVQQDHFKTDRKNIDERWEAVEAHLERRDFTERPLEHPTSTKHSFELTVINTAGVVVGQKVSGDGIPRAGDILEDVVSAKGSRKLTLVHTEGLVAGQRVTGKGIREETKNADGTIKTYATTLVAVVGNVVTLSQPLEEDITHNVVFKNNALISSDTLIIPTDDTTVEAIRGNTLILSQALTQDIRANVSVKDGKLVTSKGYHIYPEWELENKKVRLLRSGLSALRCAALPYQSPYTHASTHPPIHPPTHPRFGKSQR